MHAIVALQEWPDVNASIQGNEIIYHDYCDVSVAVATPNGLVRLRVPFFHLFT
jgi:2-oxoglutarate dehydrogenase E2 component (dihydrolipoamide succinyltransferase)